MKWCLTHTCLDFTLGGTPIKAQNLSSIQTKDCLFYKGGPTLDWH